MLSCLVVIINLNIQYQIVYLSIMATSKTPSHNANKLETAQLLALKCDPIPWEAARTYYTRLWDTKFRQIEGKLDNSYDDLVNAGGVDYDETAVDSLLYLVSREQCFKRAYSNDFSTPEARPRCSVTTDKEVKEILGSARLASESLIIPDVLTISKCVVERVRVLITHVFANNARADHV
jgi:hypothetical protein